MSRLMNYKKTLIAVADRAESVAPEKPEGSEAVAIAWWNTSMFSYAPKKKKLSEDIKKKSLNCIVRLVTNNDVVALGEFKESEELQRALAGLNNTGENYKIIDLFWKAKGVRCEFHNYVIYNAHRFSCVEEDRNPLTSVDLGDRKYRVYQSVRFRSDSSHLDNLTIFIVHWSMRNSMKGDVEKRDKQDAARKLLSAIREGSGYKLVVGDFNQEPYEEPFIVLKGSRSRKYVMDKDGLYNPFWSFLADGRGSIVAEDDEQFLCHVPLFDCALLSKEFLDPSNRLSVEPSILREWAVSHRRGNHYPIRLEIQYQEAKK